MRNVVEIRNLTVYYENTCALSDINLDIAENDFLGIIGPNGGGKSTLLKAILGLIEPVEGYVRVFGQAPHNIKGSIGYVPQFTKFDNLFPINVVDVVMMGRLSVPASPFHRYSSNDREIVEALMDKTDIKDFEYKQIGQLSGGQLQRVLIARALAVNPQILLLDEPTANMDTASKVQIFDLLTKLNKDITIVVVTHDMGVVSSHIKSIACLNKTLHYHGEPQIDGNVVGRTYGCPVELMTQGISCRVANRHKEEHDV